MEPVKDLVKIIAQALVDNPKLVSVTEISGNNTSILELRVARPDIGKVIGREGRTAGALRTILTLYQPKKKSEWFWKL